MKNTKQVLKKRNTPIMWSVFIFGTGYFIGSYINKCLMFI